MPDDDAEVCPKCGGDLYPIVTIVTEVAAAADRIEHALVDGQEANACWSRIEDVSPGERPIVSDIAKRLAEAVLTPPISAVLARAREYARATTAGAGTFGSFKLTSAADKALDEAVAALHGAAKALEAPCRVCGIHGGVLDADQRCAKCVPKSAEANLNERCRRALATFDERDPKAFVMATGSIIADQPTMTAIEFFDRAIGAWDPSRSRRSP